MSKQYPLIGPPIEHVLRELLISRGRSGYVALYRYQPATDTVLVLRVRHQRDGRLCLTTDDWNSSL